MSDTVNAISTAKNTLSQEDYMRLMAAQLANQDPLEPMDNTAFLAQLAQFTSLQQTTDISQTLASFATSFEQVSAMNFLGKEVTLKDDNNKDVTGIVSKVSTRGGIPYITIGEKDYEAYRVFSVSTTHTPTPPSNTQPTP